MSRSHSCDSKPIVAYSIKTLKIMTWSRSFQPQPDSSLIGVLLDSVLRWELSTKFISLIHHILG